MRMLPGSVFEQVHFVADDRIVHAILAAEIADGAIADVRIVSRTP